MVSVPLQYDSLKIVMEYLEPNLRFKLAQRVPSVRLVEKVVPLKIDYLKFEEEHKLTVNDTQYQLGVYRDYPADAPRIHQKQNNEAGSSVDLDDWGFDEPSGELSPGDVELPRPRRQFWIMYKDQEYYEQQVDFFQQAIAERLEEGQELIELPATGPLPLGTECCLMAPARRETPEQQMNAEIVYFNDYRKYSIGCLQYNLQNNQEELFRFYSQRNNIRPMFTPKLQLTVTSPGKSEIHRYNYTMKLHEAFKNMCTEFFGARHSSALNVGTLDSMHAETLRLPVDLKFLIRELRIRGPPAENYEALKHVIDGASFPLDTLFVHRGLHNPENCDHEMLRRARSVVIYDTISESVNYLPVLLTLRNLIIQVQIYQWWFPMADQITLIRDWLQSGRPVGSNLSYTIWRNGYGRELINQIKESIAMAVVSNLSVTIPMSFERHLLVTCHEEKIDRGDYVFETKCTVVLKIGEAE